MFIIFPQAIAADCKRVTVLKYFLEALCGQEEPLLAFKGGKYISVATPSSNSTLGTRRRQDSLTEKEVTAVTAYSTPNNLFSPLNNLFLFITEKEKAKL